MDNFQIVNLIGKGTFGSVYKCINKNDNKSYAVKKIKVLKQSSEDNRGTLNELHILYFNTCPFILKYFSCVFNTYEINIITKFCINGDLNKLILKKNKTKEYFLEKDIWKIFLQICYGIHFLHNNNIIHRDLKSANIFLEKDYKIKIGDFGISKILGRVDVTDTQIGTPLYLSPEQVKKGQYGTKTDMWSLGCILYELITLKTPFNSNSIQSLYHKIRNGRYIKINNVNKYNDKLIDIIKVLLVINETKRFSIDQLLDLEIIKDKEYLAPYYDITQITGDEIPPIKCGVPRSIQSWKTVYEIYKKRETNYKTPSVSEKDNEFKFNKLNILPKIEIEPMDDLEKTITNLPSIKENIGTKQKQNSINKYSCLPPVLSGIKNYVSSPLSKKKAKKSPYKLPYKSPYKSSYKSPYKSPYKSRINSALNLTPINSEIQSSYKDSYKEHNSSLYKQSYNNIKKHKRYNDSYRKIYEEKKKNIYSNNIFTHQYHNDLRENILIKIGSKHDRNYRNPFTKF